MGITSIGLGFSDLWVGQAGLGAVHGLAFGLANTVQLALLFEVRPRDRSAAPVMAWYAASMSLGYGLGAPLGANIIEWLGTGPAFVVSGLVGLTGAAVNGLLEELN